MLLYKSFKNIIEAIKPLEVAWFTTFNMDPELFEKYLLSAIIGKSPQELRTAEDFEALNVELHRDKETAIDIRVWYDYRALNFNSPKRTIADFIPIDVKELFGSLQSDAVFHPKVIFLKGKKGAYIIAGSANLSIAAWGNNCESVLIKRVDDRSNAREILSFFSALGATERKLEQWADSLKVAKKEWQFTHTLSTGKSLIEQLNSKSEELVVWAPYFSKDTIKLATQIQSKGFRKIQLIPDITESGKIRITRQQVELIGDVPFICFAREPLNESDMARMRHAKVWLTKDTLAVGSWNFSHKATGVGIAAGNRNMEAGIIEKITEFDYQKIVKGLQPFSVDEVRGLEEDELTAEWNEVLSPFTLSCKLMADWETFTYEMESDRALPGYTVALPHNPKARIPFEKVTGTNFQAERRRLLKDKAFTVYNEGGKAVFQGYIQEKNKASRVAYGYNTLLDLFESLSINPLGETGRKRAQYTVDGEPDADRFQYFEYKDSESYYLMFVSFQKLYDKIEEAKDQSGLLDSLGFRLPSSLINIQELIRQSKVKAIEGQKVDALIFHWFLVGEYNRCVHLFNQYSKMPVEILPNEEILGKINAEAKDKAFIKQLTRLFQYAPARNNA